MITFHTLILERDPEASGRIILRDGAETGPIIMQHEINNGSFPQSVTTKTNELWVTFQYQIPGEPAGEDKTKRCKHLRACIRFLMELTTNYGKQISKFPNHLHNIESNMVLELGTQF